MAAWQGFPLDRPRELRTIAADHLQPQSAACPAQAQRVLGLALISNASGKMQGENSELACGGRRGLHPLSTRGLT